MKRHRARDEWRKLVVWLLLYAFWVSLIPTGWAAQRSGPPPRSAATTAPLAAPGSGLTRGLDPRAAQAVRLAGQDPARWVPDPLPRPRTPRGLPLSHEFSNEFSSAWFPGFSSAFSSAQLSSTQAPLPGFPALTVPTAADQPCRQPARAQGSRAATPKRGSRPHTATPPAAAPAPPPAAPGTEPTRRGQKPNARAAVDDSAGYTANPHRHEELAVLVAPGPDRAPPPDGWSRQSHPAARYVPLVDGQAFVTDHLTFRSRAYTLTNPGSETITWDYASPVAANNGTARGTAASIQFTYRSLGASETDFDSSSRLEIRVWDREHPHGHRVLHDDSPTHRRQLVGYAGIAARDPGTWTLTETRNGQASVETFTVSEPPAPAGEWGVESRDTAIALSEPLVAFVNDDWLLHSKTYALPAAGARGSDDPDPDDPEDFDCHRPQQQKKFRVTWNWLAPDPELNRTRKHSYLTVKLMYRTDGDSYRLRLKVWDPAYPDGRLVRETVAEGSLDQVTLTWGAGLATFGNWSLQEKVDRQPTVTTALEARQLVIETPRPDRAVYPDNGDVPYTLHVEARPDTWTLPDYRWQLDLAGSTGVLRSFEGSATAPGNTSEVRVSWDGRDQNGQPVPFGSSLAPRWSVRFDDPG